MDTGSIAIKKDMSKIIKVTTAQHTNGTYESILLHTKDGINHIRVLADNIIGLDNLYNEAKNKILVRITYGDIPYNETHEFENIMTYCGGVTEWFSYRSYTFHFHDETCSTIELSYSSPDVRSPELEFIE